MIMRKQRERCDQGSSLIYVHIRSSISMLDFVVTYLFADKGIIAIREIFKFTCLIIRPNITIVKFELMVINGIDDWNTAVR